MVVDVRVLAYLPHAQDSLQNARLRAAGVVRDHPAVFFLLDLRHFSLLPYDMLLRKIGRGIFLQAAHEIYPEPVMHLIPKPDDVCVQILQGILVLGSKFPSVPEKPRNAEVHDAPEIKQGILNRSSGHRDPEVALERLRRIGDHGSGRLDALRLIEHDD